MDTSGEHTLGPRPSWAVPRIGDLLVATPSVADPLWRRSIILILSGDEEGSLGLMLNRRASLDVEELPDWVVLADDILIGGPVSPNGLIGLAKAEEGISGAELISGLVLLDLDDLEAEYEERSSGIPTSFRLFAGYCGWGEGQLQGELERGDWAVVPVENLLSTVPSGSLLEVPPEEMWGRLMRGQRLPLRLWATLPAVSDMN